jgi:uncharacterized RDD family membrane protein YckC
VSTADPTTPPPFEPASLFKRCAAFSYDLLILVGLVASFTLLAVLLRGGAIAPGSLWFQFALLAIVTGFFCGFWAHGGQTLGMRAWRIRVVGQDGAPLSWSRAALRFAAGVLAVLPLGLGLWWGIFDAQRRGWHDRLTNTRVVRVQSLAATSPAPLPRS